MRVPPVSALQMADRLRLRSAYAAALDLSVVESWASRGVKALDGALDCVGEGGHFRAWLLPARSGPKGEGLRLVLKVATGEHGRAGTPEGRAWREAMAELKSMGHPLVPPFELLDTKDGRPVLVMPYGPDVPRGPGSPLGDHWLPLDRAAADLEKSLAPGGLTLAEGVTIRAWHGIPFAIDFSDLRRQPFRSMIKR